MQKFVRTATFIGERVNKHELFARSAEIAFYLFLSIFPFLIFVVSIVSRLPFNVEIIMSKIEVVFPAMAASVIGETITRMITQPAYDIMSLSFIFGLWTASRGTAALMRGINRGYETEESRGFFKRQGLSIFFTVCLAFIIILSILTLVFGDMLSVMLSAHIYEAPIIWKPFRILLSLGLLFGFFLLAYMFMPGKRQAAASVFWGSLFSTVAWVLVSQGFAIYVNYFKNYSIIYGSLGGIIILMVWFYLSALVCLLGGECNGLIAAKKKKRQDLLI